jgi:hypothetical protein
MDSTSPRLWKSNRGIFSLLGRRNAMPDESRRSQTRSFEKQHARYRTKLARVKGHADRSPLIAAAVREPNEGRDVVVRLAAVGAAAVVRPRREHEARAWQAATAQAWQVKKHAIRLTTHPDWSTPRDRGVAFDFARWIDCAKRGNLLSTICGALLAYALRLGDFLWRSPPSRVFVLHYFARVRICNRHDRLHLRVAQGHANIAKN